MADSAAIRAGRAFVEIFADDSKLRRTLGKSQAFFNAWGKSITAGGLKLLAAGTGLLAPLVASAKVFATMGSDMARAAARTGLTVEAFSQLKYAAEQSGVGVEGLETGLKKMAKTVQGAREGSDQAAKALHEAGVSVASLKGLSPEKQLEAIADGMAKITDPTKRTAAAMEIFGKTGTELIPLLDKSGSGIAALMAHADALGLTMSHKDATAALEFGQRLNDLWEVAKMGVFTIGGALAPVLRIAAKALTDGAGAVRKFVAEQKQLAVIVGAAVLGLGAAFVAAGAGMIVFGTAMKIAGVALGAVNVALGVAGSVMGALVGIVGAILSPMGLMVAALAGIGGYFVYVSETGTAVGNSLVGIFKHIWDSIRFVFDNASSASQAWALVMAEAGFYVREAWAQVKGFLVDLWIGLKGTTNAVWDDIGAGILSASYAASKTFLEIWAKAMHAWNSIVNVAANAIQDTFLTTSKDALAADLEQIQSKEDSGALTHDQAEKARASSHKTFDDYDSKARDQAGKTNDADLDKRLAAIKAEYDQKQAYLADLKAKQAAATAQESAEARAANAKELTDAVAAQETLRKAFEAAAAAKHKASGEKSLSGVWDSLVNPNLPGFDQHNAASGTDEAVKSSAVGTFNTSAAFGLAGSGALERNTGITAKATQETAKVCREILSRAGSDNAIRFSYIAMALQIQEAYQSGEGALGRDAADTISAIIWGNPEDGADDPFTIGAFATPYFPLITSNGNVLSNFQRERLAPYHWRLSANYKSREANRQTNDASFSFSTGGGTQHVTHSIQTFGKYPAAGATAPDFGGGINVTKDSIEGVDIHVPSFDFKTTFYVARSDMSEGYIRQLYRATGRVNQDAVTIVVDGISIDFEEGELLFLGAEGSVRGGFSDWELTLNWSALPNQTDLRIGGTIDADGNGTGGIVVPTKRGWDYLWVFTAAQEDADAKVLIQKPTSVQIEQVYYYLPLSGLLRPATFGQDNSQGWTRPDQTGGGSFNAGGL